MSDQSASLQRVSNRTLEETTYSQYELVFVRMSDPPSIGVFAAYSVIAGEPAIPEPYEHPDDERSADTIRYATVDNPETLMKPERVWQGYCDVGAGLVVDFGSPLPAGEYWLGVAAGTYARHPYSINGDTRIKFTVE